MRVDAESGAHPVQQFAAERFAAGEDAAELDAGIFNAGLPHQFQRGRRQEHVADVKSAIICIAACGSNLRARWPTIGTA